MISCRKIPVYSVCRQRIWVTVCTSNVFIRIDTATRPEILGCEHNCTLMTSGFLLNKMSHEFRIIIYTSVSATKWIHTNFKPTNFGATGHFLTNLSTYRVVYVFLKCLKLFHSLVTNNCISRENELNHKLLLSRTTFWHNFST